MRTMKLEIMNATTLSNVVTLGFRIIPQGRRLEITERAEFAGQLYFTLFSSESAAKAENMRLQRLFTCDDTRYVIVAQPLNVEDEDPEPSVMVLRVLSPNFLGVISGAELQHVLPGAIVAWAGSIVPTADELVPVLGRFASVEI